ncbi:Protein cornichon homolog 1 [Striga hermonthica]|uniref:Protein cornichon homolog 1 n=1 Tax=Striga hermonthica TaxID=68872 RepID=A0A9N7P3K4_STRHE|nr:Protein cornichon homolog 1 [Striga hermonthica]
MAWEPVLWIVFAMVNLALLGLNFYQFLGFSDLEADYLNPYELSSRVNYVIVLEYLLQGAFSILFLVTGHWIMFLLSLPPAYYNLKKYLARQHLIDVTEVFRVLNDEKKVRIVKLIFYIIFFVLTITRLAIAVIQVVFGDDDDDPEGCRAPFLPLLPLVIHSPAALVFGCVLKQEPCRLPNARLTPSIGVFSGRSREQERACGASGRVLCHRRVLQPSASFGPFFGVLAAALLSSPGSWSPDVLVVRSSPLRVKINISNEGDVLGGRGAAVLKRGRGKCRGGKGIGGGGGGADCEGGARDGAGNGAGLGDLEIGGAAIIETKSLQVSLLSPICLSKPSGGGDLRPVTGPSSFDSSGDWRAARPSRGNNSVSEQRTTSG